MYHNSFLLYKKVSPIVAGIIRLKCGYSRIANFILSPKRTIIPMKTD